MLSFARKAATLMNTNPLTFAGMKRPSLLLAAPTRRVSALKLLLHCAVILGLLAGLTACHSGVREDTKDAINKGGEAVGKAAGEFFEGVSEGVERTLQCTLELSPSITEAGVSTGAHSVENEGGKDNKLVLYLIFENDFKRTLTFKAFNKAGEEVGRTTVEVNAKAGEAGYYDVVFDERTQLESKSRVVVE